MVYGRRRPTCLTGKDDYLEVDEKGTGTCDNHMRFVDPTTTSSTGYHGVRVDGRTETKLFSS